MRKCAPKWARRTFKMSKMDPPIGQNWANWRPRWGKKPFEAQKWAEEPERSPKNATKEAIESPKSRRSGPKRESNWARKGTQISPQIEKRCQKLTKKWKNVVLNCKYEFTQLFENPRVNRGCGGNEKEKKHLPVHPYGT